MIRLIRAVEPSRFGGYYVIDFHPQEGQAVNLLNRVAVRRLLRSKDEAGGLFIHPIAMRRALNQIEEFAAQTMSHDDLQEQMDAADVPLNGDAVADVIQKLLDFLNQHWADILALILKFLPK